MDKVVILARVSTQAQDYQRQVTELQEYCDRAGWEVTRVFANKVSGAKALTERTEIVEMVEYIKSNDVKRVVCLEISRLGRNTLEALKVINYLNENGVSLYVKNYNLETLVDGKVNPVASLICTILLEIASMERLTIKERITSGRNQYIAKCKEQGINILDRYSISFGDEKGTSSDEDVPLCGRRESNPYASRHQILSLACLPISTRPQTLCLLLFPKGLQMYDKISYFQNYLLDELIACR